MASRAHHGPPRYAAAAPGPAPLSAASITRDSVDAASRAEAGGRARPLSVRVFIGAQGALDGAASSGQWGVVARAGMESSRFALSAYAVASLASDVADPYFSLRLARHALGAAFDVRVPLSAALELAAGLHGGAALYHRTSSAKSPLAVSHPASLTAAVMFGPEVSLGWMLGRYGVGLVLALDILPRGPRFETAGQGPLGDIQAHTLWVLQPRLSLGMEAALP